MKAKGIAWASEYEVRSGDNDGLVVQPGLERVPVTDEVAGSNPVKIATAR